MICENVEYIGAAGLVAYSGFEYWMGKTNKTKANSLIEFLAVVATMVIIKLMKGQKNGRS